MWAVERSDAVLHDWPRLGARERYPRNRSKQPTAGGTLGKEFHTPSLRQES